MAITGNPGDLATGGFGTGIRGLAATPRDVANAVSRGEAMASARMGSGGGGGGNNRAGPLDVYGNEFTFTNEELNNAILSNAPALLGSRMNPSVLNLMAMQKKVDASPELQGIAAAMRAPFMAGYQAPAGLLDSAISTATAPSGSFQGFGLPEVDLSSPITSPNPDARYNELYSSLPSVAPMMGVAPTNQLAGYMGSQTMPYGPRVNPSVEPGVSEVTFDGIQQSVLPDLAFGNPADSLAEYGWMFDNPKLPIGMRNFNPGNLKYTGSDWQENNLFGITGPSKYTDQGDPQIQFSDPISGMASAVRLALAKQSQGMDTVAKIITNQNGWTPGNTAAANNIAKTMGVDPNAKINLQDPITMDKFMKALVRQEHGPSSAQYGQDVYNAGINVAFNAYGLGNPKLGNALNQVATKPTAPTPVQTVNSPSGMAFNAGLLAPQILAKTQSAPSPAQVVMAPSGMAFNAGLLASPSPAPVQTVMAPGGTAFNAGLLAPQILAQAQPQVVEVASAPEAPPAVRPTGAPTRLASLLFDRALERAMERGGEGRRDRRRKKPSTTTEQTMSDTIEGLLV